MWLPEHLILNPKGKIGALFMSEPNNFILREIPGIHTPK